MGAHAMTMTATIGTRIRRERQARNWTLDRLAAAAGMSRRQLVNVERGEANPSIGTLLGLSDALGIALATLVETPSERLVKIHRSGEGTQLWTGKFGGHATLLIGTQLPDFVNLWDWHMNPGERHESRAHPRGCREVLHVLAGEVSLNVAGVTYTLSLNDSIAFPGDATHAYANTSVEPARFSLTVCQPQLSSPRERAGGDA